MPHHFDPQLVNDPFGDPGLYVDLMFERRALIFDLGDLSPLPPRKLLRVSDAFVSHRHMDHFAGFDRLLRVLLGREKVVRLFGPAGLIDAVEHKLKAYCWNLVGGYEGNLVFEATELEGDGRLSSSRFCGRAGFEREAGPSFIREDGVLIEEQGFKVRAAMLDHGIPVLAFALEERAQINIWRNRVEAMGLATGPWLRGFKDAILRGDPDGAPIEAALAPEHGGGRRSFPVGLLKREIMRVTSGRKIAYVVDAAFTEANARKIVSLVKDADILFIEATFLQAEAARAAARLHLTAHQAGALARLAGVKRLVTLHYSPRYKGQGEQLKAEAEAAFRGEMEEGDATAFRLP